jgi:hypothetical protein
VERLRGGDVQVEQPGNGQIDRLDLAERDVLVEASQFGEVAFAERQRGRRAQGRPRRAIEVEIERPDLSPS